MPLSKTDEHSPDRRSVVISQGEPSGIGPEISLKTWIRLKGEIAGRPIRLVGSSAHFRETASRIGCDFRVLESAIIDAGQPVKAEPGHPSPLNAPAVTAAIRLCVAACVDHKAAAMVTAILVPAGVMFAELWVFHTGHFARMLVAYKLRWLQLAFNGGSFDIHDLKHMDLSAGPVVGLDNIGALITSPSLWIGLAVAAAFVYGAIWLRGKRSEI